MDNNLNDQTTENSEGEEKSTSSYTDPNAGYTEAEPQAKNDNSVFILFINGHNHFLTFK